MSFIFRELCPEEMYFEKCKSWVIGACFFMTSDVNSSLKGAPLVIISNLHRRQRETGNGGADRDKENESESKKGNKMGRRLNFHRIMNPNDARRRQTTGLNWFKSQT